MNTITDLLHQGTVHLWLFIPSAILLGALHGLEPGHSKTMMAAFIIAVRGTVRQAVLLGLAATLSHTIVVWIIALAGLHLGQRWSGTNVEPWLQLVSAAVIILIALWMAWRTWRESLEPHDDHDHHHVHHHAHDEPGHAHDGEDIDLGDAEDAHARAHAADIHKRFDGQRVTTSQIVLFGLTGGLIPCPAAITVLLLCIQLKQVSLGFTLVLCFSVGLALTMVSAGVVAALSLRHVHRRWPGFDAIAKRAPYASAALIVLVGLYTGWSGWRELGRPAAEAQGQERSAG